MIRSKYPNDKYGKALLVGGSLFIWSIILLLFKTYGYTPTWELWKVPAESPQFSDFRLIPGSAESSRMGIEPSERNPGDPKKRKFNYPIFWRLFFYTSITQADTVWISILMILLFFAGVFLFPQKLTVLGALCMLLIVFSPASMLLYERGNVDLIVFFLCVVIVLVADYSIVIAAALLIFGTIVKLFPFFGISVLVRESKTKFLWLAAACFFVLLLYMYVTWDSVSASWNLTMRGKDISYGANVFFYRYDTALSQIFSRWLGTAQAERILEVLPMILASILVLIAGVAGMGSREPLTTLSERNLAAFRMGASIYIGTFLLGNNWDYRLAFLILVMPQLLQWLGPANPQRFRIITIITLVAVFASCWHFVVWYSPSLANIKEFLFVFDEFLNWLLAAGFSYLLGASRPGWLKEQFRFFFPGRNSVQAV